MVITAITLENFKGIQGPCRIELRPLTMLFGANSAGKSSVVQALHYGLEIFDRCNLDPSSTQRGGQSLDLGGFRNIVHRQDDNNSIILKFDVESNFGMRGFPELPGLSGEMTDATHVRECVFNDILENLESVSVEVEVAWSKVLNTAIVRRYAVSLNNELFAVIESTDDCKQVYLLELNGEHPLIAPLKNTESVYCTNPEYDGECIEHLEEYMEEATEQLPIAVYGNKGALPEFGSRILFSPQEVEDYGGDLSSIDYFYMLNALIVGPGLVVRKALQSFVYLGPIREIPGREFGHFRTSDPSRWANGLAAWDALYSQGEDLIRRTNDWLASDERLDSGYRVELEEFRRINENSRLMAAIRSGRSLDAYQEELDDIRMQKPEKRLYLLEEAKNIKVLPQDIGVGISQVLPVVVGSLMADKSILAIEQPELHIHPKLQVALGDLFIQESTENNSCFIIETHSEHLMLRIMRRIRETADNELPPGLAELHPDSVSVYHVESQESGTVFYRIRIDEDGNFLDRWPQGFFEERDDEL